MTVRLDEAPVRDLRPLLDEERRALLALLASLSETDWLRSTECGHWRVKDVALHLLDADLGWLSRDRDGDTSGLLDSSGGYSEFVAALDAKNEAWVRGADGLSQRIVVELLQWSGEQVDSYFGGLDLTDSSSVIWAAAGGVPLWFDIARDFTERWVHQRHIRDAVGVAGDHDRLLPEVLRTFVWAYPHQYRVGAPKGAVVELDLDAGGHWHLERSGEGWRLGEGPAPDRPSASLRLPEDVGWRLLTGLSVDGAYIVEGDPSLFEPLLDVRAIIT